MAKFKIATQALAAPVDHSYEMEALASMGAEIVEVAADSENAFIAGAHDADAIYAKGRPLSSR